MSTHMPATRAASNHGDENEAHKFHVPQAFVRCKPWDLVQLHVQRLRMAFAEAALQRPRAPKDGEYHRMETDNPAERFKNGMKMQLFGSIAIFEIPKRKKRKSYTLTLSREDEHSIGGQQNQNGRAHVCSMWYWMAWKGCWKMGKNSGSCMKNTRPLKSHGE